jgi:hypothetical protein
MRRENARIIRANIHFDEAQYRLRPQKQDGRPLQSSLPDLQSR